MKIIHLHQKWFWTCSMHPNIRSNEAGDCPICGMDLIPIDEDNDGVDPNSIRMSETAMQLAQIETMIVRESTATKSVRVSGKITEDSRTRFTQTSHLAGRLEELSVNYDGQFVDKGQVIAKIYSPQLVTAQKELLEARRIKDSQPELFASAKEKLKNWKLSENQIERIIISGKPIDRFPIVADASGFVSKRMLNQGEHVVEGSPLFEISDLSRVWAMLDVYESDLVWVNIGDSVSIDIPALPSQEFSGKVTYIDPIINSSTRTAQARIELNNLDGLLKPEMLIRAVIKSNSLENKKTFVPKSAIMWTGTRSVVYVKESSSKEVRFTLREVSLGADLGEQYVIVSGLKVGEEIAVNGTFSIDAAAQLAGKPSMMNRSGGKTSTEHNHGESMTMNSDMEMESMPSIKVTDEMKKSVQTLLNEYLDLKTALVNDNFESAQKAGKSLRQEINAFDKSPFSGNARSVWDTQSAYLKSTLEHVYHANDIEVLRTQFIGISKAMIAITQTFNPQDAPIYEQFCPMANSDKGAYWLSTEEDVLNPYFGASMLTCGEVTRVLE